jgi:hypothetical protein
MHTLAPAQTFTLPNAVFAFAPPSVLVLRFMPKSFTPGRPHWWQWLTVLSLDAPLVAVLWQALFAHVLSVRLGWHDPALIGLTVWIVYVADRWIEGWRLAPEIVRTQRHYFYIRWRWPVFALGLTAIVASAAIALTRLDVREFKAGFVLLVPTLLYLFSHQLVHRHHPLRLPKEICIAVIFALGCALAPAVQAPERALSLLMPMTLFGLLCFADCALIAVWETDVDTVHGQTSLALQWTRGLTLIRALPWLLLAISLAAALLSQNPTRPAAGCAAASSLLLGLLDVLLPHIGREAARALVDVTLTTPLVFLVLQ